MRKYAMLAWGLAGALALSCGLAETGGFGRALERAARAKILRRDLARDAATAAKPLPAGRTVWRYTSKKQTRVEAKSGVAAGIHLTSRATPGRPPTGGRAQARYGLTAQPEARQTVQLCKGQPARLNNALGGEPGVGELTSTKTVPTGAIVKVTFLK